MVPPFPPRHLAFFRGVAGWDPNPELHLILYIYFRDFQDPVVKTVTLQDPVFKNLGSRPNPNSAFQGPPTKSFDTFVNATFADQKRTLIELRLLVRLAGLLGFSWFE